ncbi:MAG: peptidoglycan-binding protein, partial [Flavobacterium sp.]
IEIEDLQDRLAVQKDLNRKMITLNKLNINLNAIDETKTGSVDKLKLILDANKNIQDVLIAKLDSLAITMERDLVELKNTDVETIEESKKLEKTSYKNIGQTNEIITQLKQNLAENKKIFTGIMNKVQRLTVQENQEYKKKVRENLSNKDLISLEEMNKLKVSQLQNEQKNTQLLTKIDQINVEKKNELKRKISKATFYSSEAREYDDKLALVKLQRYQKNAIESQKDVASTSDESVDATEIRKKLNTKVVDGNKLTKIEVIRNLKEVKNGYYMVANLFTEASERDEFAMKLTDSGETKTSFFYNVGNFSYYVYTKVFNTADEAIYEYNLKINEALYKNLFIVQISNEQ